MLNKANLTQTEYRRKNSLCTCCGQPWKGPQANCLRCRTRDKELKQYYKAQGLCRCGKTLAPQRKRCQSCITARQKNKQSYKIKVFDHYGRVCKCCGEREPEFLQIDHKNNDGAQHRKEVNANRLYRWLCTHGFPDTFQTLCSNCNWAKRNDGICPHERKRRVSQ